MIDSMAEALGPWWLLVAAVVAVLGVGRWARLVVYDTFPPAEWLRQRWVKVTLKREGWRPLFFCWWCFTPWLMLVCIGWFLLTFAVPWIAWAWWLFWGWGALSYLSSMVISRDEPAGGKDSE